VAERFDLGPLLVGIRLGYARVFMNTRDGHGNSNEDLTPFLELVPASSSEATMDSSSDEKLP